MSYTPKSTNVTMKFQNVIIDQITVESVKMGKDSVPLIRYGPRKEILYIQGPWLKMSQYGVPPGETLSNGAKNEFYGGEDSRLSIRFPIDKRCCVQIKPDEAPEETNAEEIEAFIIFLKALDAHIKNTPHFMTVAGIDEDEKEKYVCIYRKPAKSKKADAKMKVKLDTDGLRDEEKKIKTEVYQYAENSKDTTLLNVDRYISLEDFDTVVGYNSEVLPIIQLVKVWTQSTGAWGITLKLKKIRVKSVINTERANPDFVDSDEEVAVITKQIKEIKLETKPESKPETKLESKLETKPKASVKVGQKGIVEVESDEDEITAKPIIAKPAETKKVVKAAVQESESGSDSGSDSDSESGSESEEEVKPAKKTVTPAPVAAKKVVAAKTTKTVKSTA